MKISHMKKDELFEGFYLIKSADLRQTRAGKNYLAFTFQDDSGEIEGKLWDAQPHNVEAFTAGKVVHMKGRREVYNNTPQVNQITLRLPQPGEPNDPADFKVKSPVDAKQIRDYMSQMIFKIENPVWQRIVRNLYTKYDKEFYSYPAAKTNHHAFETGLAFHTATMVRLADAISEVYPQLNKSLLYAGIMLHDLAKVIELTGPDQTEYTVRGNLLGHIALIDSEITKTVMELGIDDTKEEVVLLRHVILSHHGLLEYGSPVRPRIMEAEIIHMIDNLDASMMMMSTALALVDKGEMTNKIFAMDNRSFYKLRRSDRMVVISNYLINNPYKLTSLNTFAEKYESAKSSISEDIVIIKRAFEEIEIGHIQTVTGAGGGVIFTPSISSQDAKEMVEDLRAKLSESDRILPGGYIYLSDLLSTPAILKNIGRIIAKSFMDQKIDAVMTVATKGVPLANAVANVLNVPFVIVRRDLKITEGSTVSVNYVSGSSGDRIEKMFLSKRSLKAGSRVLIVDDFLKGGGTVNGMISLLREFDSELAGVAVFADNAQEEREKQFDYKSLLKVTNIDVKNQAIDVEVGNIFDEDK